MTACRSCGRKRGHQSTCPRLPRPCPNCQTRQGHYRRVGLCLKCYRVPEVRARFVTRPRRPPDRKDAGTYMTMADLDAMIAEQMKPENLPPWWANSTPDDLVVRGKRV